MMPTSHAMIGYLVAIKQTKRNKWLSVIGAVVPDIPQALVWLVVGLSSLLEKGPFVFDTYHERVHGALLGQMSASILHSLFFWLVLGIILFFVYKKVPFFVIGGLTHVVVDFLTHQGKFAWNHLYPINVPPMNGLIDYWTPWFIIPVHVLWVTLLLYWYFKNKKNTRK